MNRVLIFLLFLFSPLLASPKKPVGFKIVIPAGYVNSFDALIAKRFAKPFRLTKLTFESDVFFQEAEFSYLVGLKEGMVVRAKDIKKALFYLFLKNKFERIEITLKSGKNGNQLHFSFSGFVTLSKLKIKGILIGKDTYRQYYLIEPGEPFEQAKHAYSIKKIKESFYANGFFKGTVEDSIEHNEKTKSVTVNLTLKKGSRFSIGKVHLQLITENKMVKDELQSIKIRLKKQFLGRLAYRGYAKYKINEQTQALKRYLMHKGFLHISIELKEIIDRKKNTVDLVFTVDLHHKKAFVFLGNQFFSSNELLERILLFGRSAWMLPASILSQEIKQAYKDRGFWQVSIEHKEEDDRSFFIITEGSRACIAEIVLKEAQAFSIEQLYKNTTINNLKESFFNVEDLTLLFDSLTSFYLKQGFWEFAILNHEFESIKDQNYRLLITLDEGRRSYLHGVTIEGFDELSKHDRFTRYSPANQVPFTMEQVTEQKKWLTNYFHDHGFANSKVLPEIERDDSAVFLHWKIQDSSKKVCFGKTVIVGSSTFPYELLVRELQYHEGDIWNQKQVKKSFMRIKDLNVFEHIHLYPVAGTTKEEKAIVLKAFKDDPLEIRLRVGLGAQQISQRFAFRDFTYKAGGTFIIKNPLNAADHIRVEGDFTKTNHYIRAEYIRPWLWCMPVQNIYKVYNSKFQYPGLLDDIKNLYEVVQQGFLVGFNRKWSHIDFGLNSGFEWMETTISNELPQSMNFMDIVARAINFKPQLLDKKIPYFVLEPTVLIDCVDNNLNPTRGFLTVATLKGMFPLGTVSVQAYFLRVMLEQSVFFPVLPLIFAFRVRFGHIFHEQFNTIMPSERFYLGGANSIRSYETDMAPPLGVIPCLECEKNFVPKGGKSMININAEVRFPIYRQFGAVIFQDLGALSCSCLKELSAKKLLAGTGFGLRYNTPIGPLRFDIGWKWHVSDPCISRYAWFLTFGQAF